MTNLGDEPGLGFFIEETIPRLIARVFVFLISGLSRVYRGAQMGQRTPKRPRAIGR